MTRINFVPLSHKDKHLYTDESQVKKALADIVKKNKLRGDFRPMNYYFCQICGGWHIGHKNGR